MPRKQYKVVPDSIVVTTKKSKGGGNRYSPVGRTNSLKGRGSNLFVEDVLQDIGNCCGVDHCDGTVSHYPEDGSNVEVWSIRSGVFGPELTLTKDNFPSKKWGITADSIVKIDKTAPVTGRVGLGYVEDILNEQANCCGTQCCGGLIRLPNYSEGIVYEFGTDAQGATIGPIAVEGISPGSGKKIKKKYKIIPDSIHKRGRRRLTSTPGVRNNVDYFEDVQQGMMAVGYYGFDCCGGYIFLPDLSVPGNYYRVSIENQEVPVFVLTAVTDCNEII